MTDAEIRLVQACDLIRNNVTFIIRGFVKAKCFNGIITKQHEYGYRLREKKKHFNQTLVTSREKKKKLD